VPEALVTPQPQESSNHLTSYSFVLKNYLMRTIPASELPLNPDGSIYHLNLFPEDVAPTVLLVGDPERVPRVSQYFDRIERRVQKREFVTHLGELGKKRIMVLSTGIGTGNIDIVINELDALVNIDLTNRQEKPDPQSLTLIRIGTSGGLVPELEVGSQVVSRFGIGLDNLLSYYAYQPNLIEAELFDDLREFQEYAGRLPVTPYVAEGDAQLAKAFTEMRRGITMTCPGFYAPQSRKLRLASTLSDELLRRFAEFRSHDLQLTNFEMETSAIYGLARLLGHRALSCNAILANRPAGAFSEEPKVAEDRLIRAVLEGVFIGG